MAVGHDASRAAPLLLAVPRAAPGVLGAAASGLALLVVGCAVAAGHPRTASWCVLGGFLLLTAAAAFARAGLVPVVLGAVLSLFGGLSAVVATGPTSTDPPDAPAPLSGMVSSGVVRATRWVPLPYDGSAFRYALVVTVLGGVACLAAAIAGGVLCSRRAARPGAATPEDMRRIGMLLVAVGFLGILGASIRWARLDHGDASLFISLKAFWSGGSYLLLLADFAIPGLGIWLASILATGDRRAFVRWAAVAVLYLLVTAPLGQRGFAIQLALVVLGVVTWHRRLPVRWVAVLAVVGLAGLLVTQAARDAAREDGLSASAVSNRLRPGQIPDLFANQVASFQWTWDVAQYRGALDVPNTFVALAIKPVPRSIYPSKIQGFGDEFTRRLFPSATAQQVSFATPLVAEADASFGLIGVPVVLAVLGLLAAGLAGWVPVLPRPLQATAGVAVLWGSFAFLRGDLANASVVVAGWAVPLLLAVVAWRRGWRVASG